MDNMFDTLMRLPLFQGISHERISTLIEKYPFHFLKFADGDTIIHQGQECTHMRFLVSGQVQVTTPSSALRVSLKQVLSAPNVIGPDYLFGRYTQYPYDVTALGTCGILQLSKAHYVEILQSDKVFLFNILNYLSRNSQRHTFALLHQSRGLIGERFAKLILSLTTAKSEHVVLTFKQKDLCTLLGARRTSLINALAELEQQQIIKTGLTSIQVLDRKALVKLVENPNPSDI